MSKKIRDLKNLLLQAGFDYRAAKGSHTLWSHPSLSQSITISGSDYSDAKPYLEKQVNHALGKLREIA
jgi:predicted RNA binding protein YcfA (HicA-like mRNA interferase family)